MKQPVLLNDFLSARLKPVGDELSANGLHHIIIGHACDVGATHMVSDLAPKERAEKLRALAVALLAEADKLAADGSAILRAI